MQLIPVTWSNQPLRFLIFSTSLLQSLLRMPVVPPAMEYQQFLLLLRKAGLSALQKHPLRGPWACFAPKHEVNFERGSAANHTPE
jgi:hypothetical protein